MSRAIVPVSQLSRRLPELGRLKFGVTTERAMKTIDKWRVVSNHRDALADIANLYGGTVRDYSHPKSDLTAEVLTTSAEIKVGLPTYSGEDIVSLNYEQWSGGGCQRRCDGVTCMTWVKGPEGSEEQDQPCFCVAAGEMACKVKMRVSFFLPGVSRFGVWRLETGSWNAVAEMRGMADLLISLQAKGITEATLALDKRSDVKAGQTRNFVVPEIRLEQNFQALAAGEGRMGAMASGATAQIGAGTVVADVRGDDEPEIPVAATGEPSPPGPLSLNAELSDRQEVLIPELVGEYPDGWEDFAGPQKTKVLKAARSVAERAGYDVPSSFDEIDADLAMAAVAELA